MTTIDRAGLAREIERIAMHWRGANGGIFTIHAMSLEMAEKLDEWFAAALRKPDQKGEAGGAGWDKPSRLPVETLTISARLPSAAPQPAPEAGKLPSEEALRRAWLDWWQVRMPSDFRSKEEAAQFAFEDGYRAALLSPAQPHDVPAGEDGDGLEQRFQEGVATGRATAFAEAIELARLEAEQNRGFLKDGTVPRAEATLCILTARGIQNAIARASRATSGRA